MPVIDTHKPKKPSLIAPAAFSLFVIALGIAAYLVLDNRKPISEQLPDARQQTEAPR